MNQERWERIKALYDRAQGLSREEARAYLSAECRDDTELLAEVQQLLDADAEGFLESPPLAGLEDPSAMMRPRHIGGLEIGERIGSGAFGVVYRAFDPQLQREVAVKVLPPVLTLDARDVERFLREARSIAKLRHPGIVAVHAVGREGDTCYFAMELVDGEDLRTELDRVRGKKPGESRLPADRAAYLETVARLVAEAADALQHAHDHRIVHRDVKPANLLLDGGGHVRVVDFGLARDEDLGRITRTDQCLGTPHYMSPEQLCRAREAVDYRTDVYSLGVVLYEFLTLRPPFRGRTYQELISDVIHTQPPAPRRLRPELPRDLDTICTRAMEKDVAERYPDAAALRDDLRRWLAGRPIVARPWSPPERAARWVRAHRKRLGVLGAVLIALGLGGAATRGLMTRQALARLDLALVDEDGQPVGGSAAAQPIDPVLGVPVGERALGPLPVRGARLEPGQYRLVLRPDRGRPRTLARLLEGGSAARVTARARAATPSTEGMVRVEGGTLSLRDADAPLLAINGRELRIDPFWLDACEVSNADYRRFLEDTAHPPPSHWERLQPELHDELPVVNVGWEDARAYAEWAGKRLPSFAEWTWAARGAEGRQYPWPDAVPGELRGNCARPLEAVTADEYVALYLRSAVPVRSQPGARTAAGVFHLFGNVAEWTESPAYERSATPGSGFEPRPHMRLFAGEAWSAGTKGHTLSTAFGVNGMERTWASHRIGFRCALSAASP